MRVKARRPKHDEFSRAVGRALRRAAKRARDRSDARDADLRLERREGRRCQAVTLAASPRGSRVHRIANRSDDADTRLEQAVVAEIVILERGEIVGISAGPTPGGFKRRGEASRPSRWTAFL